MNLHVDNAIFQLQQQGGISRLWRSLLPTLRTALPDAAFTAERPDWFISSYYAPAPIGVQSLALVYDLIVDRYPLVPNRADSVDIHRAVAEASAVVSISEATAHDVERLCGKPSTVAYPGVEANFGKVAPSAVARFQAGLGLPYVLVVGRRGGYKNVQALYQAWGLWGARSFFQVVCVGGEEPLPADMAFARRYPWRRMVLSDDDLRAAYAGAHALVYPSMMEGFGLPILEAAVCACPVVADSRVAGEILGEAAFACDVMKPRSIATALDATLDPALRVTRTLAGVERSKPFTWERMAAGIADALRRAA